MGNDQLCPISGIAVWITPAAILGTNGTLEINGTHHMGETLRAWPLRSKCEKDGNDNTRGHFPGSQ